MAEKLNPENITSASSSNSVAVAISVASGLAATVSGFIGLWGAPPFWSDCGSAVLVAGISVVWLRRIFRKAKANSALRGSAATIQDRLNGLGLPISILLILVSVLSWSGWLPLRHCLQPRWFLCGTFVSRCERRGCLLLYDERNRLTDDTCQPLSDDTGYVFIRPSSWWIYKPKSASLICDSQASQRFDLGHSLESASCESVKEF
jgi:hypothetical protein